MQHCVHRVDVRKYSSEPKPNAGLWTFLWGSGKTTTITSTQPAPIHNILEYKVKASDASPFEYVIINSPEKLDATVKYLQQYSLLAIDCEGVGLSREGTLCLLQIGTENMVFLVDVTILGPSSFTSGIIYL